MKRLCFLLASLIILISMSACNDIDKQTDDVYIETSESTTDIIESQTTTERQTEDLINTDINLESSEETTETSEATTSNTEETTTSTSSQTTATTTYTITETTTSTTAATTTSTTTATTTATAQTRYNVSPNTYNPLNYREQIGVWLSLFDIDPNMKGKSEREFKAYVDKAFSNIKDMGANTVYVHVRAYGDAYYPSDYYVWTNNAGGPGTNPGYDPLKIMIDVGHAYGLSIHAWVNPMRAMTDSNMQKMPNSYQLKNWYLNDNGTKIVSPSGSNYYWLNPAYSDVRRFICRGVAEIVSNYNVDGIHIDDYFYPTTDQSFDSDAFSASGSSDLKSWRMNNINQLVSSIYSTIKNVNPKVVFGVSPQGNIQNNYYYMYADVKKWCQSSGYLDYIAPQVYFGYTNKWQPYANVIKEWNNMVTASNIRLVIGIASYKVGTSSDDWSTSGITVNQVKDARDLSKYGGVAFFRYDYLFNPPTGQYDAITTETGLLKQYLNS